MKKSLLLLGNIFVAGFTYAQQTPVSQTPLNKNVVLEELTGVNCQYCPDGHKRAKQIADANPGRVILVNIHAGGYATPSAGQLDLRTAHGTALDGFFDPEGYPAGTVQRTPFGSETTLATGRGNWAGQAATALAQASPVNMAMSAEIDAQTRVVTINVEMYYTTPQAAGTNHYLNVGIVQNNIEGTQVGATLNPAAILPNGNYVHQHAFRGFINAGGTWGEAIDASSTTVITKTITYTLPAAIAGVDLNIGDLQFFSFLHQGHNAYNNSKIITGAEITPTYVNVPAATASLQAIVNDFNIGCAANGSISPVVKVKNSGEAITSLTFATSVNGGSGTIYNWTGNIPAFGSANITIPNVTFTPEATNNVTVALTAVNSGSGTVGATATASKSITKAATATGTVITLEVLTDNYPSETTWQILNAANTVVASGGPYVGAGGTAAGGPDALKTKSHDITLPSSDCYSIKLMDQYGDGFTYGNNPGGGYGFRIKQGSTVLYSKVQAPYDFGASTTINGVLNFVLGINENEEVLTMFNIYPNPAQNLTTLDIATNNESKVSYKIVNALGQTVIADDLGSVNGQKTVSVNTSSLNAGMYFVNFSINGVSTQKPLSIIK